MASTQTIEEDYMKNSMECQKPQQNQKNLVVN